MVAKSSDRRRQAQFEHQVEQTMRRFAMVRPGDHILVAVSGGADSTALLLCLHRLAAKLHLTLSAAHLNHGIRGEEADADADFARGLCEGLRVPFHTEAQEIRRKAVAARRNLEDLARQARYNYLRRVAAEIGADRVALGHNLNDQAETVLMRLFRGSGVEGLSAVYPVVDEIFVRPLLECRRDEILRYLRIRGAEYREDSTNIDVRYHRNRVREELIPYLQTWFNPRVIDVLARHARLSREVAEYLRAETQEAFSGIAVRSADGISLRVEGILKLHGVLQKMVIRTALAGGGETRPPDVGSGHIDAVLALCAPGQSGRRVDLPGRRYALRQFDLLLLGSERSKRAAFHHDLAWPGRLHVPEVGIDVLARLGAPGDLRGFGAPGSECVLLDADTLPEILYVRSRLPGDRYGGPRRKKVKRMMIDAKIPLRSRAEIPMIATRDLVVWIPGFKPAKAYALRSSSRRCLCLEIRPYRQDSVNAAGAS